MSRRVRSKGTSAPGKEHGTLSAYLVLYFCTAFPSSFLTHLVT